MKKKFLCVCQDGNVRSVAAAYRLKKYHGCDAIAAGWRRASADTFDMLCAWADHIVVMEQVYLAKIPERFRDKAIVLEVGPDRYGLKIHPDLNALVVASLDKWRSEGFV